MTHTPHNNTGATSGSGGEVIVSLDIGTSKLSAVAVRTADGSVITSASAPNDADVAGLPTGHHEQDARRIATVAFALLRDVVQQASLPGGPRGPGVAGVAISGQMHGVLLLNDQGEPATNLITWRDQRGSDVSLTHASSRTGCELHPGYGGATLAKLDTTGATKAVTIADYIASKLTGIIATDPTHGASWGIYNLARGDWDDDAIKHLRIDRALLPPLRATSTLLGPLTDEAAAAIGLPVGTPVTSPIGDNQASFIGAAGFASDVAVVNLGTGGQVSVRSDDLTYRAPLETRPMPFGGAILVGASLCGGWSYAYLRQFFQQTIEQITGQSVSDEQVYTAMNQLAASSDGGGLIADTRYLGTRGDPAVRGSITNIDATNLTPGHLARSVLEGMVSELAAMARTAGVTPSHVVAGGNAVRRNDLVQQLIAEQFGATCAVVEAREEAAVGAAMAAARGLGLGDE